MNKKHALQKAISGAALAILLMSSSAVFAQVKIGTNPTVINAANNLEVEASTTGRKTSIDKTTGQVTIKDGTEGAAKLLTSDANGGASWKDKSVLNIPETMFTGYGLGNVTRTTSTNPAVPMSVPFTNVNPAASWNSTNDEYTIPSDGLYRFEFNATVTNLVSGKTFYNQWLNLIAGPSGQSFNFTSGGTGWNVSLFVIGQFTAGEKAKVIMWSYDNVGTRLANPVTFSNASMFVTKIQ